MPTSSREDFVNGLLGVSRTAASRFFYQGEIAEVMAADMARNGGLLTLEDIRNT